ncbi:hypothetical protein SELMODRAFT_415448 [Selaginella moellendorffii]|uniref:Uncharacterized protein n=1 Tax=Selaginella moellendorffii TaxID=88036 RepID=D8RW53_SELML|nr:hypothetical protein SELMODRAFT_415448 [Selaginella moellendorffii]
MLFMRRHGQKPQGTSFMQNTFTNESRPGPMHTSPRAVVFKRTIVAYRGYVFRQSLETISSTSGCDQGLLLIASKEDMISDPQRASLMCELIKMREKLAMAEAWARARLQMQYEDDFFYNYDEWDSFVDLSTLRSSSGECCSISYLLEKWSWLKEQFARIRTSRLLESSTGRWKKAKVTHGVSKPALGLATGWRQGVGSNPRLENMITPHSYSCGLHKYNLVEFIYIYHRIYDRVVTRNKESIGTAPLNTKKVQDGIAKEMLKIWKSHSYPAHKYSNQQYIGDCSAPGLGRGLWPRWHRNVGASIKDLLDLQRASKPSLTAKFLLGSCFSSSAVDKDKNSTSKLKAASLVIAFILLYKLKLSRSKHGRELLMDKIDTRLMQKLKNRKYIVNMWKTLVEAKRPRSRISWFITKYVDIFPSAPTMMNSS